MFAASMVMAITIGGFASWLHYHEVHGWPEESDSVLEQSYRDARRRRRTRIHAMLACCSVLIAVAGIAGAGRIWVACWSIVMAILITIVFLAMLDAVRTHRYFRSQMPQIRQRILDDEG